MRDVASIVGLKVISSKEGREVGTVSQVIVDLASGAVEGLIVGKGPSEKGVEAKDIDVIGLDAVMVGVSKVARHLSELPKLMEKRRDPAQGPREVVTDTGKRVGVLGALYIDPSNKRVTRYEVSGGAWRDITEGVITLAPMEGTVDGRDSIVVPISAFSEIEQGEGGLKAQFAKLASVARIQAKQAAESLEEGAESVKRGVAVVGEKASEAAAKIKESSKDEKAPEAAAKTEEPSKDKKAPEPAAKTEEPSKDKKPASPAKKKPSSKKDAKPAQSKTSKAK